MYKDLHREIKRLIEKYKRNYCSRKYDAPELIADIQNKNIAAAREFRKIIIDKFDNADVILHVHEKIYGNYENVQMAKPVSRVISNK